LPHKTLLEAMQNVTADSTDPATTRPALDPIIKTGSGFIPMDLPPFVTTIALPPYIHPIDAWGLFLLFFPENQIRIICQNTNQHMDIKIQAQNEGPELPPRARIKDWRPLTVPEAYRYLGIRIYMGIHGENQAPDYWTPGDNINPDHPVSGVMSLRRYEAIHGAWRLCTADPDHKFEAVFDRVSLFPLDPDIKLTL
jgi:hypothetical protein